MNEVFKKIKLNKPTDGEIPRCSHKPTFTHTSHRMWLRVMRIRSSMSKTEVCGWCVHIVKLKKWMPCVLNPFHYWSQRRKVKNAKFTSSIKNHSFSFYPRTFWHQERDGCGGKHKNAAVRKLLRPLNENCWWQIATVGGKRHGETWVHLSKARGAVRFKKSDPLL
jgi:hypothetical protein